MAVEARNQAAAVENALLTTPCEGPLTPNSNFSNFNKTICWFEQNLSSMRKRVYF